VKEAKLFIYEIWQAEIAIAVEGGALIDTTERFALMVYSITDADEYGYRGVIA
jgi:hypothetical protein